MDDGQWLRESQPHGATPDSAGRSEADGFTALAMSKPPVTVVVKKRRGQAVRQGERDGAEGGLPHGHAQHAERRPRVYQVHPALSAGGSAAAAGSHEPSDRPIGAPRLHLANAGEEANTALGPAGPALVRRRRARRDPTRAPGEVTRIVFETPPPQPVAPSAASGTRTFEFIEPAEGGYEQVMAELRQLGATLDLALSARKFRLG